MEPELITTLMLAEPVVLAHLGTSTFRGQEVVRDLPVYFLVLVAVQFLAGAALQSPADLIRDNPVVNTVVVVQVLVRLVLPVRAEPELLVLSLLNSKVQHEIRNH